MAGQTPRFGFNFFGGDTPGDFTEDDEKFTGEDRLTLDRLLTALENHTHRTTSVLATPDDIPDLAYDTGGDLEAGTEYFYVVSFVNASGLETAAGPEASIEMPALLPVPDVPSAETGTGEGSLAEGMYYYALTALRDGEETPLSEPVTVTVLADENLVTLTLPDLGDATSYQVWRMADNEAEYTRVGTSSTDTFTDDGSVPAGAYGDPANTPPIVNTGASAYAITITLTGDDLTRVASATAWRIYRTEASGTYGAASLVHEVVEREDELDDTSPLLTSWIDDGDAMFTGSPKLLSQEMHVSPFTLQSASPLPAASAYPENYPILGPGPVLYVRRSGVWTAIGGEGGGGGGGMRGVALFTGTGAPSPEPADGFAGDLYIDLDTGDLYALEGA